MATLKRKSIIDAVKTRMKTITTAAGYRTGIGANVGIYRTDMPREITAGNTFYMDISDVREGREESAALTVHNVWALRLLVEVAVFAWKGNDTADFIREAMSDILKAIGTDYTFGGLATHCTIDSDLNEMNVEQNDSRVGWGIVRFYIHYRINAWSGE